MLDSDISMFEDRKQLEHHALIQIRKHSQDAYNRIHSIAEDIDFIEQCRNFYTSLPMLANLRCGAWYCDSRKSGGVTAHFKSMDGHYNGWSFNLRRPNLHILPLTIKNQGIILVDSTRSGKRMPDSFSKTVPIWCAVINRALKLRGLATDKDWDITLYTPPQIVSRQEHSQIEEKIPFWAEELAKSSYDLPLPQKSLRPVWITPSSSSFPSFDASTSFTPVICLSASRLTEEGLDRRRGGYVYVQGAGDDHEHWSKGLSPRVFWENKDELLSATELSFPEVLEEIVKKSACEIYFDGPAPSSEASNGPWKGWKRKPTPVAKASGLISISSLDDVPVWMRNPGQMLEEALPCSCVIIRQDSGVKTSYIVPHRTPVTATSSLLEIRLPADKKGCERGFKASLTPCVEFAKFQLGAGENICISCPTGSDLSVGLALVVLQTCFDIDGKLSLKQGNQPSKVDKETLRTRLHWIIASRPEANPSRATLKRINDYFMSPKT